MSRKDYVAIAAVIRLYVGLADANTLDALRGVARGMADIFANDNPRFNRDRFYAACGMD